MKGSVMFFLTILLLSGCSFTQQEPGEQLNAAADTKKEEGLKHSNVHVPNPQVTDDSTLKKEGDTFSDRKGELTLKTVKNVKRILKVEGVEYTINDIKLLHYIPAYSLIDFYHPYTHAEEFDFVKIDVEVKNQYNEEVHFAPIAMLKINGSIQRTWEDDFYLEELNGEIAAGQVKRGSLGFIVEDLDEISEVELLSGDLVGKDQKKIAQPTKLAIKF